MMIWIYFIIIIIISKVYSDENITGPFFLCHQNNEIIDMHSGSYDILNSLSILKKYEDEFSLIYLKNSNPLKVYSKNGLIYSTSCNLISHIMVAERFNECTVDLPVYYMVGLQKRIVFLTKSTILRNTSFFSECHDEPDYFFLKERKIQRLKKTASVLNTELSLKMFSYSKDIESTSENDLLDLYYNYFAKNKLFIAMRDMINFVFMIIVTFFGKDKIIYFIKWSLRKLSNGSNIFKYYQRNSNTLHHELKRPQSTILKFIHPKSLSNAAIKTSKSSDFEVEYAVPTSFPLEIKNKTQITTQYCKCKKGCSNNHCKCRKMGYNCNSDCSCFNNNCQNLKSIV